MANHKTKLELTWIGKENRPKLEPRILVEAPAKSYHAKFRTRANRHDAKGRTEKENLGGLGDLVLRSINSVTYTIGFMRPYPVLCCHEFGGVAAVVPGRDG